MAPASCCPDGQDSRRPSPSYERKKPEKKPVATTADRRENVRLEKMDSFWNRALGDEDDVSKTTNGGAATTATTAEGGYDFGILPGAGYRSSLGSIIPPVASEAESRLRTEKLNDSRRNRWIQALLVALLLGGMAIVLLWCWCPRGLSRRKARGFEVDSPSPGKIAAVGSVAAVAGFAIGWLTY